MDCESSHKPVFIPPKKRVVRKTNNKGSNSSGTNRRIHSYDIVTRVSRDVSGNLAESISLSGFESPVISQNRKLNQDEENVGIVTPICKLRGSKSSPLDSSSIARGACASPARNLTHEASCSDSIAEECDYPDEFAGKPAASSSNDLDSDNCSIRLDSKKTEFANTDTEIELTESSALNHTDTYLTLTGTIKRGKKAGQCIDIKLNMSREELEELEADISKKLQPKETMFGAKSGLHVFLFTFVCAPFIFILSGCYSFYIGTFTWYNMYIHFSEERTIWHKIFICPFLVLTYPFWVPPAFVSIGLYAAFAQLSWHYDSWITEVQDFEKGFFGWMCASLDLNDCAPYEVVILNDQPVEKETVKITETTTL